MAHRSERRRRAQRRAARQYIEFIKAGIDDLVSYGSGDDADDLPHCPECWWPSVAGEPRCAGCGYPDPIPAEFLGE